LTAEVVFPAALRRFVSLFNAGRFWDSHEVLEEPWRANRSDFYQGLILFASAYVHAERGNTHGTTAQMRKVLQRLAPYPSTYLGIDVERIRAEADRALEAVSRGRGQAIGPPALDLDPARCSGEEPELTS
jgi:uncharacterized protein